jgi:hypothetical protein
MPLLRVAVVSRDQNVRLAAARAFDAAPASWRVELHESAPVEADVVVLGSDIATGDGIRFAPARPERVVEEVERAAAAARTRSIVVAGAGGGTGVTSVALHLAAAAGRAAPTCFVDLDLAATAADRLGFSGERIQTWGDVDASRESLRRAAIPFSGGFRILLSPGSPSDVDVRDLLRRTRAEFERIVVDVVDDARLEAALDFADAAVLLMAATVPGARRAARLLERFADAPWLVISNRMGPGGETTRAGLQRVLGRRIAVELPCSRALRDSEDEGRLVTASWSRWKRGVDRVYRVLERA